MQTDRFDTVTEVVVITADCAFRSNTRNITRRWVNRLGFTRDIPLIGGFFQKTPRAGKLNTGNQVGLAFLAGNTLYIDTRPVTALSKPEPGLLAALARGPTGAASADLVLPEAQSPDTISVVNRNFQFLIGAGGFVAVAPPGYDCGRNALARMPSLAPLFARPEGTAHLLDGQLVALVKPSIIAGY